MIRAHTVAQVRAAEAELGATLPPGTMMARASTGLAHACARVLGRSYGFRFVAPRGRTFVFFRVDGGIWPADGEVEGAGAV